MVLLRRDNPYICFTQQTGGKHSEQDDSHDPDFAQINKDFHQNYMKFQEQQAEFEVDCSDMEMKLGELAIMERYLIDERSN